MFLHPQRTITFLNTRLERTRQVYQQLYALNLAQEPAPLSSVASKVLYYEDLVDFVWSSAPPQTTLQPRAGGDLNRSAAAWLTFLGAWGLRPERQTVLSVLSRYVATRSPPRRPHSALIENFAEVHAAMKRAGGALVEFVRDV